MFFSSQRNPLSIVLLAGCLTLMTPPAHAEGGSADSGKAVDSGKKVTSPAKARYHSTIKVAKPSATKTPDAPIPYTATTKAVSPSDEPPPPPPAPQEQASSVYDLPSKDISPPLVSQGPLPAPILPSKPTLVADNPPPHQDDKSAIILKCDTVVFSGSKAHSSGSFYIGLFPLEGIEDQWSDFRIYRVDPRHDTLLRLTYCLDKICSAQVNDTAYFLIAQSDKKTTLRITLDRYSGAYLAEYSTKSLVGLMQTERYEKGTCQKATLGQPKF